MAEVRFLPPAAKYLKKIKDKRLKALYQDAIEDICSMFLGDVHSEDPDKIIA